MGERPAVLITLYRGIAKLARAFAAQMVEEFPKMGLKVFQRRIGITVAIQDAQANGRSIYEMNVLKGRRIRVRRPCGQHHELV